MALPAQFYQLKQNHFEALKVQIEKDFVMCGIPTLNDKLNPKDYFETFLNSIINLHKYDYNTLKNLLYRVDVKEKDIESTSIKYTLNLEESIAVTILNRTLQKVEFKKKFNI